MTAGFKLDTLLKVVTRELISYITRQRQSNVADVEIEADLQKGGWTIDDINLAFLQINAPTSPVPTPPSPNNQTVLHPLGAGVKPQDDPKIATGEIPAIVKILSIAILMIAILFSIRCLMFVGNILMLDYNFQNMGFAINIIKSYPGYGILPIVMSLVAIYLFFVAFKVFNGSRFSYWLGVVSLIVVPVGHVLVSNILLSTLVQDISQVLENGGESPVTLASLGIGQIFTFENLIVLICIVVFIVAFRQFHFRNLKTPVLAKVFLVVLFILFVIPISSFVAYRYFQPDDTDNAYQTVSSQVGYPVYRPAYVPAGLTVTRNFKIEEELFAGKENAVGVVYDISFEQLTQGGESRIVSIKQVGVEPGFDLLAYATDAFADGTLEGITLSSASNGVGYLFRKSIDNFTLYGVSFITADNVLISMVGLKVDETDIIQMANSMSRMAVGM